MSFLTLAVGRPNPVALLTWQTAAAFIYCTAKGVWEAKRIGISFGLIKKS